MSVASRSITGAIGELLDARCTEADAFAFFEEFDLRKLASNDVAETVKFLRSKSIAVDLPRSPIDTCGTGGSGKSRINTSTLVAFVVAEAGGKVAKHGNKAASGRCGSFDLLEALGANIDLTPLQEKAIYEELGIVFLFARTHHPVLGKLAPLRKKFGKPTIFNVLGPLLNPARTTRQIVGVSGAYDARLVADAMKLLGIAGLVVQGSDGLDEITATGTTKMIDVSSGEEFIFDPREYGIEYADAKELEGGSVDECVNIAKELASGRGSPSHRDLVLVNAAHALMVSGLVATISDGISLARETLKSGKTEMLILRYIDISTSMGKPKTHHPHL